VRLGRHAQREGITDRKIDDALHVPHVVVAVLAAEFTRDFAEDRRGRFDKHRAARHVAAEQRALDTLEHLDGLQVEEGLAEAIGTRLDDFAEIGADRRIGKKLRFLRALTAQRESDSIALTLRARDGERRGAVLQALHIGHAAAGKLVTRQRRHRDRHVLDGFLTAAGRDDDVATIGRGRRDVLVIGRLGIDKTGRRKRCQRSCRQ
jgi:hypothetical protein